MATDGAAFALPPSQNKVVAGDVVKLDLRDHKGLYRIDRMEESGLRLVEASRVDPQVYVPQALYEEGATLQAHVGPTPVEMLFLDLPLLTGDETPHEPYVAPTARPWPGSVALYSSPRDSDYILQEVLRNRATVGVLKTPLLRGPTGIWDRQQGVEVKLVSGALSSVDPVDLFSGANTLAIGDGTPDNWEIVQYAQAAPTGTRRFGISQLLRGQAGTSAMIQDIWPAGSFVVVMNGKPKQIWQAKADHDSLSISGLGASLPFWPVQATDQREKLPACGAGFQGEWLSPLSCHSFEDARGGHNPCVLLDQSDAH